MRIFVEEEKEVVATTKISTEQKVFIVLILLLWLGISIFLNQVFMPDKSARATVYGLLCSGLVIGGFSEFLSWVDKIARPPRE